MKEVTKKSNEKTPRNQLGFKKFSRSSEILFSYFLNLQQVFHQRDKYLGCPLYKILGTALKMDEGRISTNEPGDKKTNDDASGLISVR